MIRPCLVAFAIASASLFSPSCMPAQGLIVRTGDGEPTAQDPQNPAASSEIEQEIRALRAQAEQLNAMIEKLKSRAQGAKREMADAERMKAEANLDMERERQARAQEAKARIERIEQRVAAEIERIKTNAQREIEKAKAEAKMPQEPQAAVRSRKVEGERGVFVPGPDGLPQRRVATREMRVEPQPQPQGAPCCGCACPMCGRGQPQAQHAQPMQQQPRHDMRDPAIDRIVDEVLRRLDQRGPQQQFRMGEMRPEATERQVEVEVSERQQENQPVEVRRVRIKSPSQVAPPPMPRSPTDGEDAPESDSQDGGRD